MADLYFTSDTHSYVFPTDYISSGKKDMGYLALSSGFTQGGIIADGGDVLQGKRGSGPLRRGHHAAGEEQAQGQQHRCQGNAGSIHGI